MVITYSRENDVGVFTLQGAKDLESGKAAWERFRQAIVEDHLRGVLVLDECANSVSPVEVIEIEAFLRKIGFPLHIRVAIVDTRGPANSDNPFGETVARNRGWSLITVFPDEAAARTWLGAPAAGASR